MTDYTMLLDKIRTLGMDSKWAISFIRELKEDENYFCLPEEKRNWALKHGFFPGRIEQYNLSDDNICDFLPDYQYAMMHPLNNHFLKWLDKLTLKYVLNSNGCAELMPDYYVYVENELCGGRFTYLMDCPTCIPKNKEFLWNLLKKQRILAMKPNSGTAGGLGFIKLELRDEGIFENNKQINWSRFEEIRDTMRNYIITEYVHQHPDLAAIWSDSECTLRVIMAKEPTEDKYALTKWSPVLSYARFGTSIGGGASNLSSGGIGIGFDYETGEFYKNAVQYRKFAKNGEYLFDRHPDTGVVWNGFILPNWGYVKNKIGILCQHISSLDYLGLDIIITERGMKMCEINSLPSLGFEQMIGVPLLKNKKVKTFFNHKGLESINSMDFFKAYMECQRED